MGRRSRPSAWALAASCLAGLQAACGCANDTAHVPLSPERGTAGAVAAAPDPRPQPPGYGAGLTATAREWTWIDVPESRCANGSATGFAVNVEPDASHLVLFLEGGGACDNGHDCWEAPTAVNIASGYAVEQLGADPLLDLPLFRRDEATNPFADATYVFVPYCTGDLHAGQGVADYTVGAGSRPTYHYGARNLDLYLRQLGGAFPAFERVWLVGQSAGGFGTLFNQTFVAQAFGVRTDVIDDSGPGIGLSGYPASWQVRLPADCAACALGLGALYLHDRRMYPSTRFAFLSYRVDDVLPGFYGATQNEVDAWLSQYEAGLFGTQGTHAFVVPGAGHVVMRPGLDPTSARAVASWLGSMATDDPAWQDEGRQDGPASGEAGWSSHAR